MKSIFFFFSVKCLTLVKIYRLTITEPIKINETYYKICDSVTVAYRALGGDYGSHSRPTTQAIGKIVDKL